MLRLIAMAGLLALMLSSESNAASSPIKDLAKRVVDRNANWVIERYDIKTKQFGKPDESADPSMWAIYITSVCEQRRDYKEANGPFISDPVQILAGKVKDDGSIEGGKDDGLTPFLAAQALESTKNDKYKPLIEKLKSKAKAPLPAELKTLEQLTSVELKPETLLSMIAACRALAKDGKKEIAIGDKTVNWAETITEHMMKREKKSGQAGYYTGDLRTDALVLQLLNVCYKQL